jgi:ribosomal protein L6P/L9E
MSRIGKKPVSVPSGVTANVEGQTVKVKGPKGALQLVLHDDVSVSMDKAAINVQPRSETKRARSQWGTARTLVNNLINGVTKGFEEKLEINGVGYRAAVQGKQLNLPDPAGHRHRDAQADRNRHHRRRQAAGRPSGRRNPQLPWSGALQGQGREVRRRIHLPQGR